MMNSISKPGSRISLSILITSSSWQTARHLIVVPIFHYTLGRGGRTPRKSVECSSVSFHRRATIALFVLAFAGTVIAGQQVPVFRTGIDLVNFGVTVTDKKGNLVTDLTAEDFDVAEDGRKQA